MKRLLIIICATILSSSMGIANERTIELKGKWSYTLDKRDKGIDEKWQNKDFKTTLYLPGSLTTNNIGDEISLTTPWTGQIVDSSWFKSAKYEKYRSSTNIKIPAWLQPIKYYKGAAWYSKEFEVTPYFANAPLDILLERVHWESSVWIDSIYIGTCNSLGTPHRYLTPALAEGKHTITIMVDNRIKDVDVGFNAHSISDHTQSNWNGIIGEMKITKSTPITLENIELYPDIDRGVVKVKVITNNRTSKAGNFRLALSAESKNTPKQHKPAPKNIPIRANIGIDTTEFEYQMGKEFFLWSEFTPYFYQMDLHVSGGSYCESRSIDFGMKELHTDNRAFYLNNRQIFLRGTLDCAIFPKTGFPPMTIDAWREIFITCKSYGLNHIRFHSWCPPKAAFEAADRVGLYLQVEGGGWCSVGDGGSFDKWIYKESDAILKEYGNHPSFMFYTYGNEPSGSKQGEFLGNLVEYLIEKDSRHLYTSAAGWPMIKQNQYRNDMYPRLKVWGAASPLNKECSYDLNFDEMISKCDIPWVSHEIGQWCVYPDFREIARYEEGVLRAKNFEIFRETLDENGLKDLAYTFLIASGKLQTILYKAEIEAALRTKDFSGFQLLGLQDFPGQGSAIVGVVNPFWEDKGYVTSSEFNKFCATVVPLISTKRLFYKSNETLSVDAEIANFGAETLKDVTPHWQLTKSNGSLYAAGDLALQDIEIGNCIELGTITKTLSSITKAEKLTLTLSVNEYENSWDFWVYPTSNIAPQKDVIVVNKVDKETLQKLENGAKVLVMPNNGDLQDQYGGDIKSGFTTIFWNSAWTLQNQPPLTLGLLSQCDHPVFDNFPTESHSNYQWHSVVTNSSVLNLTALDSDIEPITRVIDDWFENRSLGLMLEAKVDQGRLFYVGNNLTSNNSLTSTALYNAIITYMNSDKFNPEQQIEGGKIYSIFNE